MLVNTYTSILEAKNATALLACAVAFAERLDFERVSCLSVQDDGPGRSKFTHLCNAPAAYRSLANDVEAGKADPVMQHLRKESLPLIWDAKLYAEHGVMEKWDRQAAHGYKSGIAVAMHLPNGRHFAFGVVRDGAIPVNEQQVSRLAADVYMFAAYAQEAARAALTVDEQEDTPSLTRREVDVLQWTLQGKTAWEVAMILSISERTANHYINNAIRKLGCRGKHQAAAKALNLGLLVA